MTRVAPTGVLLLNLGSPDAPTTDAVRRYLREFLTDGRVIDIDPAPRWALVNLVIAPFRSPKSAEAYRKIWTEDGSPIIVHGRALTAALAETLGDDYVVALGMRYGNPSLASALDALREAGCDRVIAFPLYPQYASSSTGTAVEAVYRAAAELWNTPFLTIVPPFYDDPGFIEAFAGVGRPVLERLKPDRVLFSFHGLPERHIHKSDPSGQHCLRREDCCERIGPHNQACYRAHCIATARALATRLSLDIPHSVAFQSRLGRDPWIRPYTDEVILEAARAGSKRLAVFCPAFVADCLETLEEIGMRARDSFLEAGGAALELVPSLNAEPAWVEAVAALVRRADAGHGAAL